MKKTIAQHSERNNRHKADDEVPKGAVPHYLLDREQARAPAISFAPAGRAHIHSTRENLPLGYMMA